MQNQSLLLNIIPFTPPVQQKTFSFYFNKHKQEGFYPVFISDELLPLLNGHQLDSRNQDSLWIYSDFQPLSAGGFELCIDLTVHLQFAEHYYRYLISSYFRNIAPIMRRNFTNQVELWLINTQVKTEPYSLYYKFTLAVQHGVNKTPELIVSYDGNSRVLKNSLTELPHLDTLLYRWMSYKGLLYNWNDGLPEEALQNQHEVYPVVSNQIGTELEIIFPKSEKENRYPDYYKKITGFYQKYLDNDSFRQLLPLAEEGFIVRRKNEFQRIDENASLLEFGNNQSDTDPHTGIKNNGPYKPIQQPLNVKIFFVYQKSDEHFVTQIKDCFDNGLKGAVQMRQYLRLPYNYKDEWNIAFLSLDDAVRECYHTLENRIKEPNVRYVIVYLSPIAKDKASEKDKKVYVRLKEMFLFYGYQSQVLYRENVLNPAFNFFLPNLQIAMLAKLGGVPWRLQREPAKELIIGIGAAYVKHAKQKMLGSAFCFDNDGKFLHFDSFPADNTNALAVNIRLALEDFKSKNPDAKRLIIHFYKLMSKAELKPILETLYSLKVDVPVIVLTINKTVSKNVLAFDIDAPKTLMPYNGSYVQIAERQYLLFNNTRYNETSYVKKTGFLFPVKIKMTATDLSLLEDPALVDLLIDQVYQFSRMYWKSVKQQSMPVTILYPQMVAEIFPYFKTPVLSDFGKESLWFL